MAIHRAKKENTNQGVHHIPTAQVPMTSPKEVSVATKNLAAHLRTAAVLKNAATTGLSVNQKIHPIINQNLNAALKTG